MNLNESYKKRLMELAGIKKENDDNSNFLIINKTPHNVNIIDEDGEVLKVYEKTDFQIRLKTNVIKDKSLPDGTPITKTEFGEPEGLPEFKENTFYIVSQMIKDALPKRKDLFVPAEVVRDKEGNIIGCKSLGR